MFSRRCLSGGTSGNSYISGVINRTWNIDKSSTGAANVTVTLQWNAGDELSGFTRNASYISHYSSGSWNNGPLSVANGSGPYSLTTTGITSFSPFAVLSPAGVVPITLDDFTRAYENNAVAFHWSTEMELNTSYFTVEKSTDAVVFKPLGEIAAQSNSQVRNGYNYIDNAVENYINYYRLKIVDRNGNYTYSKIIIVAATAGFEVVVAPNPLKDELFIKLPEVFPRSVIRIVDVKGSTVGRLKLEAGSTGTSINTSGLQAGVYSLIFDAGKFKETVQFIKD